MMDQEVLALVVAAEALRRKDGEPLDESVLLHSIRVANQFAQSDPILRAAALLHEVPQDSGMTIAQLRALGFGEAVLSLVEALTPRPEENTYEGVILRIAGGDPGAIAIKIADLEDCVDQLQPDNPLAIRFKKHLAILRAAEREP